MATETTNYGLHQWDPEDSFLRTDFNEDFRKIDAAISEKLSAFSGTYVGTGVYGSTNPNHLTFPFHPQIVFLMEVGNGGLHSGYFLYGSPVGMINWAGSSMSNFNVQLAWTDNSVSWYSTVGAGEQLNFERTYHYLVIG